MSLSNPVIVAGFHANRAGRRAGRDIFPRAASEGLRGERGPRRDERVHSRRPPSSRARVAYNCTPPTCHVTLGPTSHSDPRSSGRSGIVPHAHQSATHAPRHVHTHAHTRTFQLFGNNPLFVFLFNHIFTGRFAPCTHTASTTIDRSVHQLRSVQISAGHCGYLWHHRVRRRHRRATHPRPPHPRLPHRLRLRRLG